MSIKSILTIAIFSLSGLKISAQSDTVHHVYGLVVGISEYKDPFFKGLKYADDDALMFANFLKSHLVKSSDTGNIVLLRNKEANAYAVWNEIFKIDEKAHKGDTVYIFFSGHGDAKSAKHVFLICYEGIKGQYEAGGCVKIGDLKDYIHSFNSRGIKVILITDACRSNENNVRNSNIFFTEALNENTGEIQFTSCSKNQNSYEDKRWGNGHGVFSWYLVKGWMGMADLNNNQRVTFNELSRYVGDHVAQDLYDSKSDMALQTPYFYSSNLNALMGNVNPSLKRKLVASEEAGENDLYAVLIPRYFPKGSKNTEIQDPVALGYYLKLNEAIQNEEFLEPDSNSAMYYYEQFKERQKSGTALNDARLDLIAAMANKAQTYIQEVLGGNQSISSYEFSHASRLMYRAMSMMDTAHEMYINMKARALFLEANSLMNDQYEMAVALDKLDSSLKLEPNKAYVFYDKARIYEHYNVYFSLAEENYLKAMKLAPQWIRPVIDLGYMYINKGKYDKGTEYLNKAIAIQPGPYIYYLLGYTYQNLTDSMHHGDSAVLYYHKALELDSNYVNALLGLALVYQSRLETDKSKEYYVKALALDTTYYYTYHCYGNLFYDANMMEYAEYYYKKAAEYYPNYLLAHWMLGQTYNYGLEDKLKAVQEYRTCLSINYYYTKAYTAIAEILIDSSLYDLAIEYLKIPWTYDGSYDPVDLGRAYLSRAMRDSSVSDYDSTKLWLDTSVFYFPGRYYAHTLLGTYYLKRKNMPKSIESYMESARLDSSYYYNWLMLGHIYFDNKQFDSAIYFYTMGTKNAPGTQANYKSLWQLYQYDTKDYKHAASTADSAIAHNVSTDYFYYLKTYSLWASGEFEAALASVDSANNLFPGYANYLYAKAMVLSSLKLEDAALDFLEASVEAGLIATEQDFYDGTFKNLEENKKFKKIVKKYLKNKQ